ncbi:MAG: gfo/Idh/MocA family oxidoreductase [Actinobacteria bacterium]|nr:gfo/Idh/MocA family oxidoreductase [Actinomycetota bacterium]
MTVLRAGLIGLGVMGRNHARVLASLEGVELVAVADPAGDPLAVAGARPIEPDVEALLKYRLDYCVVAAPTGTHEAVALQLASAGVHAMVEKPLAQDSSSASRIVDAFEAAGLVGAVGHIERYNPALQQARLRLANGDLGQVYQVVTRRQGPFPARIADVGVVKDLATHDIDLTAWVTQQEYESVSAFVAHRTGREHEDLVAVAGRLGNGTVTSHLVNWLSPLKERTTVITGENGAFVVDTLTADLTYYENGRVHTEWNDIAQFRGVTEGNVTRFAFAKPEPLRTQHEQFREAVLGRPCDIVTLRQGMRTVRVADAILASANSGRTQYID